MLYLVYPGQGPIKFIKKQVREMNGATLVLMNYQCLSNSMNISIPEKEVEKRTRSLVSKAEANKIKLFLEDNTLPKINSQTWNRRYREAQDRLQTGSLQDVALVLKELTHASTIKELSFGEKKMRDLAKTLLDTELNLVLG
jgi:CarD family transcriptional regulator